MIKTACHILVNSQISEVVNSMKDLMDFSQAENMGPIDSLKNYPQRTGEMFDARKMSEHIDTAQNPPDKQNIHPVNFYPSNTPPTAFPPPLNSFHYLLRNSAKPTSSVNPALLNNHNQNLNAQSVIQANQQIQHHMIQQLLQDMLNKGAPEQSSTAPVAKDTVKSDFASGAAEIPGDAKITMQNASSASKPADKGYNSCVSSSNNENQDVFENLNLPELEYDTIWEEFTY
ncbi:Transcriptional corepressor SEUSS [Apostasia shenzhenica]|uniref:Transcriptional corepressor SEUSS n=1 Tax=Apostasia shenzhenica TaxID=1088818 RepID=A0A2I0B4X4_9ASPA|nr:Transcriptional corepressor SEUSS [Apostasia shenzhenica]